MARTSFLFIILLCILSGCQSEEEARAEKYYDMFRGANQPDSVITAMAGYIEKYHPDSTKKNQARSWLKSEKQKKSDSIIISRGFELVSLIESEESCNLLRRHYLAQRVSKSEDTLQQASLLFANSLRSQVMRVCPEQSWFYSAIYLYENIQDFDKKRYFSRADIKPADQFTEQRKIRKMPVN